MKKKLTRKFLNILILFGLTTVGSQIPHSCSLTPPRWDRKDNQKGKSKKTLDWDQDSLICKAKATVWLHFISVFEMKDSSLSRTLSTETVFM